MWKHKSSFDWFEFSGNATTRNCISFYDRFKSFRRPHVTLTFLEVKCYESCASSNKGKKINVYIIRCIRPRQNLKFVILSCSWKHSCREINCTMMIKRKSWAISAIIFVQMISYFSATFCLLVDFARNLSHALISRPPVPHEDIFANGTLSTLDNKLPVKPLNGYFDAPVS